MVRLVALLSFLSHLTIVAGPISTHAILPASVGTPSATCAPSGNEAAAPPAATPVVPDESPNPVGTPAAAATNAAVIAAAETIIDCFATRQFEIAATLATEHFLRTAIGVEDPDEVAAALVFPPFAVQSLGDARSHGDGRHSVDIVYRREEGQHMLVHERWYFIEQGGSLLLDALEPLPIRPAGPTADVEVRLRETAIELSRDRFAAGEAIAFQVTNAGTHPHELAVFLLPTDASVEELIAGRAQDVEFIGATLAFPGQAAPDLVLVDLEPGIYTVACFLADPDGVAYAERGMVAQFTVE